MKIYDISQDVFGCRVFPGDPAPEKKTLSSMEKGGVYYLSAFRMCAHNGTHIDAPFHFIRDGKTVDAASTLRVSGLSKGASGRKGAREEPHCPAISVVLP